MNGVLNATLAIVSGVIGLAIVSVLMSKRSQTPQVIQSAGGALASVITAATNPYTGQSGPNSHSPGLVNSNFGGGGNSGFDVGDALDIAATVAPYFI